MRKNAYQSFQMYALNYIKTYINVFDYKTYRFLKMNHFNSCRKNSDIEIKNVKIKVIKAPGYYYLSNYSPKKMRVKLIRFLKN